MTDLAYALRELRINIENKDLIKAALVIDFVLDEGNENERRRMLLIISRSEDDFLVPLLLHLAYRQPDLGHRYPAVVALLREKCREHSHLLLERLRNPVPAVAVAVGLAATLRLTVAVPQLIELLRSAVDPGIVLAALEGLGEIGDPAAAGPVGEYIACGSPDLEAAAIRALGRLGTPAALQQLLGLLGAGNARQRNLAKSALIDAGSNALSLLVKDLDRTSTDVLVHRLDILGRIGDAAAVEPIRRLLLGHPADANIRFAAYEALGLLPSMPGAYVLAAGLSDPEEHVRAAAAWAVDHTYSETLATGVRNLVAGANDEAAVIIRALLDARADRIILDLASSDAFRRVGLPYLAEQAHPEIRAHCIELFDRHGFAVLATTLRTVAGEEGARPPVCAVDDSPMALNLYRRMLHELGYDPVLFSAPVEALAWLRENRPAVVFTDLNMPDISGIELARQLRRWYARDILPIIMLTTQHESGDHREARAAGVDLVLPKPFTAAALRTALETIERPAGDDRRDGGGILARRHGAPSCRRSGGNGGTAGDPGQQVQVLSTRV